MTSEQIDKMTLRELNDACAMEVMKWHKTDYKYDFSPATRIEEAWEVCEEVAKNTRQGFNLVHYLKFFPPLVMMRGRVAAKCICRAALKAVMKGAK